MSGAVAPAALTRVNAAFPKRCSCCGRMVATLAAWRALPYVGVQAFEDEALEYRNCACGSTLVVGVQP